MKFVRHLIVVLVAFGVGATASEADQRFNTSQKVVKREVKVTRDDFQNEVISLNRRMKSLDKEEAQVMKNAAKLAESDRKGIELFNRYSTLVSVRYVNKEGQYEGRQQISKADQKHINSLFQAYINMTPLAGRSSAKEARDQLAWGVQYIEKLADKHGNPTVDNNPDLQIIALGRDNSQKRKGIVLQLAETLGVQVNPNASGKGKSPRSLAGENIKKK